ncbi:E3 ubiquitin protein ligase RIN2-like [Curcuma longa]|uniref:E3 ubiquitin protein ligase RIN2-like n=1 Tax=Curcuma longa TaxID=136217 RepID=UPI003D9DF3E6
MAVNYLYLSVFSTASGLVLLQWWTVFSLEGMKADGPIGEEGGSGSLVGAGGSLELLLNSRVTVVLLVNFVINVYFLVVSLLKMLFFVQLNSSETRKVLERFINYIIYKGTFLPLIVPPKVSHVILWSTWLIFLCSLKIFQSIAKDRLEKLNASPSVTPLSYFRVYSALLLVLFADLIWMKLCMVLCSSYSSSLFLLLFFEPLSIAFDTLQAIMVHGFQFIEIYQRCSNENVSLDSDIQKTAEYLKTASGSLSEWKGILIRHCGFILDMMTLLTALGHYFVIWWLHGLAFHLVDVVLFINMRALISAIAKRIRTYLKLRKALTSLDGALPDATYEELCAFDDECAICRGPMVRAKKLSCNHLFHLVCLRSWLDQGLTDVYSCPTCRRPLFASIASNVQGGVRSASGNAIDGQQLAEHLNLGLNQQRVPGHALPLGASPNPSQNTSDTIWRGAAFDSSMTPTWMNQGIDGASSSSSVTSVGFGGVQMMMRQLASVSENFAHGSLHDSAWNLWLSQHTAIPHIPSSSSVRLNRNAAGLRIRNTTSPVNSNMSELLTMVDRVREVLPHVPDELIVQDLLRTNNINITVNNLLVQ